jgi:hypothetical protein
MRGTAARVTRSGAGAARAMNAIHERYGERYFFGGAGVASGWVTWN